ncbi:hypothetical protein MHBO_003227, partial [Bonamia ostreae]
MSYYNSCKNHEKELRRKSKICHKLSEKQREIDIKSLGDPLQILRLNGQSCSIEQNPPKFRKQEKKEDFVEWNGLKIDKYDCRALLDFVPRTKTDFIKKSKIEKEINCLLNFERYRSLLLHIESGKKDGKLMEKIRHVLAARNVKMHNFIDEKSDCSGSSCSSNEDEASSNVKSNKKRRKTEKRAKNYGILGFSKIQKFDSILEHNRKAINKQKKWAKLARDNRAKDIKSLPHRKRKRILREKSRIKKEKLIENDFDDKNEYSSSTDYIFSYEESDFSNSPKPSDENAESVQSLLKTIDKLSGDRSSTKNGKNEIDQIDFDFCKPRNATMQKFFPELTPVDSVEEAMNWTNADFTRRRGIRRIEEQYDEEYSSSDNVSEKKLAPKRKLGSGG